MCDLQSLIERVEKASGPDRELDEAIAIALGLYVREKRGRDRQEWFYRVGGEDFERRSTARYAGTDGLPRYTDSLDAVMALKQDGHTFALGDCNEDSVPWACVTSTFGTDYAATGSDVILAALAAILKSRLATNGGGAE